MRLTDLISYLQQLEERWGDLPVKFDEDGQRCVVEDFEDWMLSVDGVEDKLCLIVN